MGESDATIVSMILAGDPRGLNRFLSRYGHMLAEYIRALTGDDNDLFSAVYEDVLVDILKQLRVLAGTHETPEIKKLSGKGELLRPIFESAARTVRRRFPDLLKASEEPKASPLPVDDLAAFANSIDHVDFKTLLEGLAGPERELLVLRYRLGFDYAEISNIIREARVQLEERLVNARHHFRARLFASQQKAMV
ncbi:MAG: hypothetical protein HUU29_03790 [Planctomycetaceae bacterium]|nr:hypothetical protein [Planctomycetaceae bacterium]